MTKYLNYPTAIVVLLLLSGCATSAPCAGFAPIRPTKNDLHNMSNTLTAQILAHDLAGQKLCGWSPK